MKTLTYFFEISVNQLPTSGGFVQHCIKAIPAFVPITRYYGGQKKRLLYLTVVATRSRINDSFTET